MKLGLERKTQESIAVVAAAVLWLVLVVGVIAGCVEKPGTYVLQLHGGRIIHQAKFE